MRKKRFIAKSIIFLRCVYSFLVKDIESIFYLDFKRMLKFLVRMTKIIQCYSFAS